MANKFYNKINKYPVLSVEEERALFNQFHGDDAVASKVAFEKIYLSNLRLVLKYTHDFVNKNSSLYNFDDCFQNGCIGLQSAIESFDLSFNTKFSTYATFLIKQKIYHNATTQQGAFNVAHHIWEQSNRIRFFENKYFQENCEYPDVEEIANALGMTEKQVIHVKDLVDKAYYNQYALDAETDDKTNVHDTLEDTSLLSVEQVHSRQALAELHELLMNSLNDREKIIVIGLFGENKKSSMDIAKQLNITGSAVRAAEKSILMKLKTVLIKNGYNRDTVAYFLHEY
jgi:RNA polymerase sigma factor (sigma-70 family)